MAPDWKDAWKLDVPGLSGAWTMHSQLRDEIKKRYDRRLPITESMTDRWELASYLGFGEGSSVYDSCLVFGDVVVGENTWIGPHTILDGSGGLVIGHGCNISAGAHLYSHDTVRRTLSGGQQPTHCSATTIGDRCFIGPHAVVAAGGAVGDQSVILAGSFVRGNVPARTIVAGSPASVVGRVVDREGEIVLDFAAGD